MMGQDDQSSLQGLGEEICPVLGTHLNTLNEASQKRKQIMQKAERERTKKKLESAVRPPEQSRPQSLLLDSVVM